MTLPYRTRGHPLSLTWPRPGSPLCFSLRLLSLTFSSEGLAGPAGKPGPRGGAAPTFCLDL